MRFSNKRTSMSVANRAVACLLVLSLMVSPSLFMTGCGHNMPKAQKKGLLLVAGVLALAVLSRFPFLPLDGFGSGGSSDPGQDLPDDDDDPSAGLGQNCWDLNANWVGDPEEDMNGDLFVNVLDCEGPAGSPGAPGSNGSPGANGLNCWDRNGNGIGDPSEDANDDLFVNVLDCQGSQGSAGGSGTDGIACWDLNRNGEQDAAEDINADLVVDVRDCRGLPGTNGTACWDLNGNRVRDPQEDINRDLVVDTLDCQGVPGPVGASCWDTNANGVRDAAEDRNGDLLVDVRDCQGTSGDDGVDGTDGLHCWDLNSNGIADAAEDRNGDHLVNVLDCQGPAGAGGGAALFDTFIDQFFTLDEGSYAAVSASAVDLPIVEIDEPALGDCDLNGVDVVAFRTSVSKHYHTGNPVTMALYLWRTGTHDGNPVVLRLDAFHTRHSAGIVRYGEPRYILLDIPASSGPFGQTLVIELPINNQDGTLVKGLGFPNILQPLDFLAFEINALDGYGDGGCYTLRGVEFYESGSHQALQVSHATLFRSLNDLPSTGPDCNGNGFPDLQDVGIGFSPNVYVMCHDPPGNPGTPRTIGVPPESLSAHQGHGDPLRPCSADCNGNGIPDECEDDCNRDGVPDDCDGGCGDGGSQTGSTTTAASTIDFRSPASGATVAGDLHVQAAVFDIDGLSEVIWSIDGTPLLTMPLAGETSGVSFQWDTTALAVGQHTVSLTVTDSTGDQTTSDLTVNLE